MTKIIKKPLRVKFTDTHAEASKYEALKHFSPNENLFTREIPDSFWKRVLESEINLQLDRLEGGHCS